MMTGLPAGDAAPCRIAGTGSLAEVTRPAMRFCWHLRAGLSREIGHERIRSYSEFFYRVYLDPYLHRQEKMLDGVPGLDIAVTRKAKANQRKLRKLFSDTADLNRFVGLVEDKLEEHVRFGHRTLPEELRRRLPGAAFERLHNAELLADREAGCHLNGWEDKFWELR